MAPSIFLAVIAAAAMHAGWNAVLKIRLEPFLAAVLVNGCCALIALPFALVLGLPDRATWPWLIVSTVVHFVYYLTLVGSYRRADMGQVYPIARGTAPLLTTIVSVVLLHEAVPNIALAGAGVLAFGIMVMARPPRGGVLDPQAIMLALACGVTISIYTVLDAQGARTQGNAHVYASWLFVFDGAMLTLFALARRGPAGLKPLAGFLGPGFAGGAMALAAYWIVIWATTQAPVGLVAAVRETSVLFGAVIAVTVLREPLTLNRIAGAAMILAGLAMIRLA